MSGKNIDTRAWRRIAEAKIEQAIHDGQFRNLPGLGKPLPLDWDEHDENWWIKRKAKLEGLSLLPPALELLKFVERQRARIATLKNEDQVRRAVIELNRQITAAHLKISWGPPSRLTPLSVDEVLAAWREQRKPTDSIEPPAPQSPRVEG